MNLAFVKSVKHDQFHQLDIESVVGILHMKNTMFRHPDSLFLTLNKILHPKLVGTLVKVHCSSEIRFQNPCSTRIQITGNRRMDAQQVVSVIDFGENRSTRHTGNCPTVVIKHPGVSVRKNLTGP